MHRECTSSIRVTPTATCTFEAAPSTRYPIDVEVNQRPASSDPVLFSVAAADWQKLKEPVWRPKTLECAQGDIAHLKRHFSPFLVTDIRAIDVADYITKRRQQHASDKSIRNELGTLRGILKRYHVWEHIKEDVRLPSARGCGSGVDHRGRTTVAEGVRHQQIPQPLRRRRDRAEHRHAP